MSESVGDDGVEIDHEFVDSANGRVSGSGELQGNELTSDIDFEKMLADIALKYSEGEAEMIRSVMESDGDRAIEKVSNSLSGIRGAELVSDVARKTVSSHIQVLLDGIREIHSSGVVTIPLFGKLQTFREVGDLVNRLADVRHDLTLICSEHLESAVEHQEKIINIADKYMFSPEPLRLDRPLSVRVLKHFDSDPERFGYLKNGSLGEISLDVNHSWENGLSGAEVVIIDIPHDHALGLDPYMYRDLIHEYWFGLKPEERPIVIMSSEGMSPIDLYDKAMFQGFLFAESPDQLRNSISLANRLVAVRSGVSNWDQAVLVKTKEGDYDASDDLREWERITADTYKSLKSFIVRANERNDAWSDSLEEAGLAQPIADRVFMWRQSGVFEPGEIETPVRTVLDLGTGEGRIGGMLARAGFHVLGLELSGGMLERGKERLMEEGRGLRGESLDDHLSYPALIRLKDEGVVASDDIVLNDAQASQNYLTARGDFLNLYNSLSEVIANWEQNFPEVDISKFFDMGNSLYMQERGDGSTFVPTYFDAVVFNWHTFCEINNVVDEKEVLGQIFSLMTPGGELTLEIPDSLVDPYARAIDEYHDAHPDVPFGTVSDLRAGGEGEFPPRYFPSRNELVLLLQNVGFEIDPENDIETYLITTDDDSSSGGGSVLRVKELVVRARKPKDIDWS